MAFLGKAWRLLVGVKDALVLIFMLMFFAALYAMLAGAPNPARPGGGALLVAINGVLTEQPEAPELRDLLLGQTAVTGQVRLRDVVRAIETAAQDKHVKAVVLDLDGFWGGGQAALSEVAEALGKVKAAKKPIYAFATGYYDDSYLLAAQADEIWLDPMGSVLFAGPGGSQPYFKRAFDRYGVTPHIYKAGRYKSAVEPYFLEAQSPEAREANQALVDALWSQYQEMVARFRPGAQVAKAAGAPLEGVRASGGDMAKAALANGLVDRLGDVAAFGKRVAAVAGGADDGPPGSFDHFPLEDYVAAHPEETGGGAIGVVTVAGEIVDGEAPNGFAGGDTIANLVRSALDEKDLKALVVRVDSPGGSAFASEKIRLALAEAKSAGLPVIVSMGPVAASGGYWVSMAGDRVFADPSTITGSIGVFGMIPSFERALGQWGVTTDGVKTTPLSGQPDVLGGLTPEVNALFQAGVEDMYRRFVALVSERRKLPAERVQEIAQGRVWDGGTARQLGLVDNFGSFNDAVAEAAKRAGYTADNVHLVYLDQPESFLGGLLSRWSGAGLSKRGDVLSLLVKRQQAQIAAAVASVAAMAEGPAIQARCIACPAVTRPGSALGFKDILKGVFQ